MEKPLLLIVLHIGFGLWETCSGFPIDFSSAGTEQTYSVWLTSTTFLAIAFLVVTVGLIFGCVCCRNGKGFQEFSNSNGSLSVPVAEGFVNPTASSELTIFPPYGIAADASNRSSIVRFEPLPDIKPPPPNLRPASFSYSEREISSQDWFYEPHDNFPRNQLQYLQEYGKGWFGRVVEGEAQNILPHEKLTKVIVKILHEDATPTDQMYFLHEVKFYRDLKHPNVLNLLGRCLETEPFLILLESCPNGDLKSFLTQNLASARALTEQGVTLQMCCNITSGLQFMHENKFIHTDLAARNCLVGPDLTIKIGDYGNSIEIFKSDYYCAGSVALPVRWCAPETLKCTDVTIETKEVTPLANIWTLGVVIWEICEFCKLPYSELNDDQVIVRVLGEKNYFLQKPKMFCLHKDELYHLMKLCWNPPLQRPTASQIRVILENLISSSKSVDKDIHLDPKRASQDFEQRWQNSKPNYIAKKDNAVEAEITAPSPKFKGAKVADSSYVESPLGLFMSNKSSGQDSPRFCLKSDKSKRDEEDLQEVALQRSTDDVGFGNLEKSDSVKNLSGSIDRLNDAAKELENETVAPVRFDFGTEVKTPEILKPDYKIQETGDLDSWLKGVQVNNEEDETFVRKISEAIRDLDAALAMEKTSSSEENSGKSSHQNSPGKEVKPPKEEPMVVDFKLGGDTSSFMSFTPKSFELSSLQNSEQPQSLNFTETLPKPFESLADYENYGEESLIFPVVNESKNKMMFEETGKEGDSLVYAQSRNSSDTEDEIWRKRIERGEFSEKVKEKSKSIADLMVLTHIDASDESDYDGDKNLERNLNRNSFSRRSGSYAKPSLTSNNFGSENDITRAVLEADFKESLKKLSNDHKEYGRFDSLGMILPISTRRENVWDFLKSDSGSPPEPSDKTDQSTDSRNNFLGNVASEKLHDNTVISGQEGASKSILDTEKVVELGYDASKIHSNCDNESASNISSHLLNGDCGKEESGIFLECETPNSSTPVINVTEAEENNEEDELEEIFELPEKNKSFKFVLKEEQVKSTVPLVPAISITEEKEHQIEEDEETFQTEMKSKNYKFVLKEESKLVVPEINVVESDNAIVEEEDEIFRPVSTEKKSYKFILSEEPSAMNVPEIKILEEEDDDVVVEEEEETFVPLPKEVKSYKFVVRDEDLKDDDEEKGIEESSVIIGACEDYTLDYFQGLKTTFGNVQGTQNTPVEENCNKFREIIDNIMLKESSLDTWDEHLEKAFSQQLSNSNFDDISFPSLNSESPAVETPISDTKDILGDSFNSTPMSPNKTILSDAKEKNEESIHINGITNLNGNSSEEEYENGKLRTPDDERSSDSGFRDKGSLSESVEDACEGKYNLEDIEAELEEAYVKGAFESKEKEKDAKSSNNFDYEESKFYEDENKNDEDFSDIDGEIEFWQNKENSDYYPEISEFSPVNSKGWYLHPPDDNNFKSGGNVDEEFVNALRNELKEKLPIQSRSFEEFENEFLEFEDTKTDINIQYTNGFAAPLSPIIEEQDNLQESVKCPSPENLNFQKIRKNVSNIMESVKTIDTDTFMQYLDYMVESEGKDLDYDDEDEDKDIDEEIVQAKEEEINAPMFIITKDEIKNDETFEEDIKNALGVETLSSESFTSDVEQPKSIVLFEDLESDSNCKIIEETKPEDDILFIDTETNEATMLESPKPKSYVAFVENAPEKDDDVLEVVMNPSESVYTPDSASPERERSLSDTSRSSNGTRTGDASSEITLSSPDVLSDYFLTPNSEKSPEESPRQIPKILETRVQEIIQNNEADEIMNELKHSGIINDADDLDSAALSEEFLEKNECSLPYIPTKQTVQNDFFLRSERKHTSDLLEESSRKLQRLDTVDSLGTAVSDLSDGNEMTTSFCGSPITEDKPESNETQFEMSTSFMGEEEPVRDVKGESKEGEEEEEEDDDVENSTEAEKDEESERPIGDDCYTPDWESDDSNGEEEVSSSSGEFIWKDGDKESKLKAVQATDGDAENSLYEKSQSENSAVENANQAEKSKSEENDLEDEEDDEDDDSSTGSSASITDFVPSAWNSQATPIRPALRSPDKKTEEDESNENQRKRNVWFKKQKYHCVYEYPREPSDTEDVDTSPYKHFTYGITAADLSKKHFPFGFNSRELPSPHFTYGISNLIDYANYADWDVLDGDDGDLSLTDTDSDNGSGKSNRNVLGKKEYNIYNLSAFDYDFNTGALNDDGEFYVSSSARPFQSTSSSQFFPGQNSEIFKDDEPQPEPTGEELWTSPKKENPNDFITPDSGVEDLTSITPSDKKSVEINGHEETQKKNEENIINALENLKFNFDSKVLEGNDKKHTSEAFEESSSPNDLSASSSNSPSSPLSPGGLGELRHTRDKLKLDLPHNHNADLGIILNTKKSNKIH